MEKKCVKCKKDILVSNIIGERFCLFCFKNVSHRFRRTVGFFNIFATIYPYTPIISGITSLILWLSNEILGLMIFTFILVFVCMLGSLPHMFPFLTHEMMDEIEFNYEKEVSEYDPGKTAYCTQHPIKEAIGRCSICLKPFCAEDFYFQQQKTYWQIREFPAYCIKCGDRFKDTRTTQIIYGVLALAFPFLVSIFLSGFNTLTLIIGALTFTLITAIPLALMGMKRNLKRH